MNKAAAQTLLVVSIGCIVTGLSSAITDSSQAAEQPKTAAEQSDAPMATKKGLTVPKQPSVETKKVQAKTTTAAVNQIPGVKVAPNQLEPPVVAPIKGFHPIKKLLQPVEVLGSMSVKIEQQLIKLEGPIAALHPPMTSLESRMTNVDGTMTTMQSQVNGVTCQMDGVRQDLANMRKDINELKQPIMIIQKPLVNVQTPLDKLKVRLKFIFWAIIAGTFGVVFGTPAAAMYVYRHRQSIIDKVDKLDPKHAQKQKDAEKENVVVGSAK